MHAEMCIHLLFICVSLFEFKSCRQRKKTLRCVKEKLWRTVLLIRFSRTKKPKATSHVYLTESL